MEEQSLVVEMREVSIVFSFSFAFNFENIDFVGVEVDAALVALLNIVHDCLIFSRGWIQVFELGIECLVEIVGRMNLFLTVKSSE